MARNRGWSFLAGGAERRVQHAGRRLRRFRRAWSPSCATRAIAAGSSSRASRIRRSRRAYRYAEMAYRLLSRARWTGSRRGMTARAAASSGGGRHDVRSVKAARTGRTIARVTPRVGGLALRRLRGAVARARRDDTPGTTGGARALHRRRRGQRGGGKRRASRGAASATREPRSRMSRRTPSTCRRDAMFASPATTDAEIALCSAPRRRASRRA